MMQYAIDKNTNQRIHASNALYTRDGGEYICEVCGQRMHKKQLFFYHDGDSEVYCTKDTWELEEPTSWHKRTQKQLKAILPDVQLEKYLRRNNVVHRADAYFMHNNQETVIEVQSSQIDPDRVHERNEFYTLNGSCVWILNTSKLFASGAIVAAYHTGQSIIATTSTLIRNVVSGRTLPNVWICLQKNQNDFVFVEAMYRALNSDTLHYRVSNTYTWDDVAAMVLAGNLPSYTCESEVQNFASIPVKTEQKISKYTEQTYFPQYDKARKAQTATELLDVLRNFPIDSTLCSIALNHHAVAESWDEIISVFFNRINQGIAETLAAYLDEDENSADWSMLIQKIHDNPKWLKEPGLLQYYCAQKTSDVDILSQLQHSSIEQVRLMVCRNIHTSQDVLIALSQDSSPDVSHEAYAHIDAQACVKRFIEQQDAIARLQNAESKINIMKSQLESACERARQAEKTTRTLQEEHDNLVTNNKHLEYKLQQITNERDSLRETTHKASLLLYASQMAAKYASYNVDTQPRIDPELEKFADIVNKLRIGGLKGDFLLLIPESPRKWGKEIHCIHFDGKEATPKWFLGYSMNSRQRIDKRYSLNTLPHNTDWCSLITKDEAIQMFGEKYYNSPLYQGR